MKIIYFDHMIACRDTRTVSSFSVLSFTPTENRTISSSLSNRPSPDEDKVMNDIRDRLRELRCESALSVRNMFFFLSFSFDYILYFYQTIKYQLHREDYMDELLPNGYTKPIILPSETRIHFEFLHLSFILEPAERQSRIKRPLHWSRRPIDSHHK